MDKNLQNIEDLFRNGLEDNEEMPSHQVWKGIDSILDKDNVVSINKKYALLKRVSLLLLFIVFALIIYEFSNRRNNNSLENQNSKQALNKEVITTDNSNKSANILNSKKLNDSVSVDNYNKPNTATHNSSVDKSSPDNHLIIKPGNNSILEKKTNVVSAYKINIKSSTPVKGFEEVVINNNDKKTGNQLPLLQQLNPATIEKINNPPEDSIANNLLPPAVKNIIPTADEVNRLASNKKIKAKNSSRFSGTLFFSPDIAFYHLLADKPDNQPDNASKIEKGEHHEFSSTTGFLFDYRLNKKFALQTGLTFSNINITVNPKTIYAQPDNNGNIKYRLNISSGYGYLVPSFQNSPAIGDSLYVSAATHKLRYIGIPVAVKYTITKGKFSFETMAGVGANLLTKGKLETEIRRGNNSEIDILDNIQGLKSVYFSSLIGAGVVYDLSKKIAITFTPTARFALTSINKGAVVKSYPNSFGLSVGLKIKL